MNRLVEDYIEKQENKTVQEPKHIGYILVSKIVTDEEVSNAFRGTKYGNTNPREIIKFGLLKSACKYHNGYTTTQILKLLGLQKQNLKLTKKGKQYLYRSIKFSN